MSKVNTEFRSQQLEKNTDNSKQNLTFGINEKNKLERNHDSDHLVKNKTHKKNALLRIGGIIGGAAVIVAAIYEHQTGALRNLLGKGAKNVVKETEDVISNKIHVSETNLEQELKPLVEKVETNVPETVIVNNELEKSIQDLAKEYKKTGEFSRIYGSAIVEHFLKNDEPREALKVMKTLIEMDEGSGIVRYVGGQPDGLGYIMKKCEIKPDSPEHGELVEFLKNKIKGSNVPEAQREEVFNYCLKKMQ